MDLINPNSMAQNNAAAAEIAPQLVHHAQNHDPIGNNPLLMNQVPAMALAHAAQQQQQEREIWQGVVEWDEKSKNPSEPTNRITRSLTCNISINPGEQDINTSQWPNRLVMLLIPQQMLHSLQDMFRNSRPVIFNFGNNDIEALKMHYKVMANGFAGYVQLPNQTQCDLRALMLLYSSRKKQFMGLIPNEQVGFVNRMREIITERRQRNMEKTSINDAAAELALQLVQQAQTLGPTGDNAVLMSQDPATALAHAAHLQQQRREIWQGVVEWHEKSINPFEPMDRITCSLICNVFIQHGEPDINTSQWPNRLVMLLIPHQILYSLQDMFRNSRLVIFNFGNNDVEALKRLHKVMVKGFAGCVQFPKQKHCDLRVLMLLYSSRKKQFMGLIPNEQAAFVNRIRDVVTQARLKANQGNK